jgi:hypothetical protein
MKRLALTLAFYAFAGVSLIGCRSHSHVKPAPFDATGAFATVALDGTPLTIDIPDTWHIAIERIPGHLHGYCLVRDQSEDCHGDVVYFLTVVDEGFATEKPWSLTPTEAIQWFEQRFQGDQELTRSQRDIAAGTAAEYSSALFDERIFRDAVIRIPNVGALWLGLTESVLPSMDGAESAVFDRMLDSIHSTR